MTRPASGEATLRTTRKGPERYRVSFVAVAQILRASAIDYGAYVELMSTAKAPLGHFEVDDEPDASEPDEGHFVEVPADDYGSIRGAILRLGEFRERRLIPIEGD